MVRVPVDSGRVTINDGIVQEGATSYTGVITSFPLENAKLLRQGHRARGWEVRVDKTDEFIFLAPAQRRSEMEPRIGDKVKFRCTLFVSREFKHPLPKAQNNASVEWVVGNGKGWSWLETAMEDLTVGDSRRVSIPIKISEGAKSWLPEAADNVKTLHIEIRLVKLERPSTNE